MSAAMSTVVTTSLAARPEIAACGSISTAGNGGNETYEVAPRLSWMRVRWISSPPAI